MGGVTFDTTIQGYVRPHGWRSQGWRQDAADKRSEGSRRGQADNPWIPRRSGHIYMGPSPLCGTLSYKHSPHWISSPPMEESTNTTAWTSSTSTTPSMTSPSTVSTGFSSCDTRSFTENYNISRDTGSSSVSRCLVKGCVKFCLNC